MFPSQHKETVIRKHSLYYLVDDGIATGATILASARWREILEDLNNIADKVIVLYTPEPFGAVGRFYQDFNQVSDEEVKEITKKYLHNTPNN